MSNYPDEQIYELEWWGPFTLESLGEEDEEYLKTISLYAIYGDHPLYGKDVLTYLGKVYKQPVIKRLSQHEMTEEHIYVASIRPFHSWSDSEAKSEEYDLKTYIKEHVGDDKLISRIEELLIYALWPAGNIRNKNTASYSWPFRLFNTGHLGSLPPEISGHYTLHNSPEPR